MTAALEFQEVWKGFGKSQAVLRGVSFTLAPGEVAVLSGDNGAGKTTCFTLVSGQASPDRGAIRVRGVPLGQKSSRSTFHLGVRRMFQAPAVFSSLTIRDNVLIGAHPRFYARPLPWSFTPTRARLWEEVRLRAAKLFNGCPFLDAPDQPVGTLSFGQRRIVEFLRVFAGCDSSTAVLLLDEPFAGLHVDLVPVLWQLVTGVAAEGAGVLLIEHLDPGGVLASTRRLRLVEGRIL